jgi:hypothetical protein
LNKCFNKHTINSVNKKLNEIHENEIELIKDDLKKKDALLVLFILKEYLLSEDDLEKIFLLKLAIQNNLLEVNTKFLDSKTKKIYLTTNTGLYYKPFPNGKLSFTNDIHEMMHKYDICIPLRSAIIDKQLNTAKSNFNEFGVAFHLHKSKENEDLYLSASKRLESLGLQSSKFDEINKIISQKIIDVLPKDSICNAEGVGQKRASSSNSLEDPTDLIVYYKLNDDIQTMNLSLKLYEDTRIINLKNMGILSIGKNILNNDIGSKYDEELKAIWKNLNHKKIYDLDKLTSAKKLLQNSLLMKIAELLKLCEQQSQDKLECLWKNLHGENGNNPVWKCIANSTSNSVELISPGKFLNPKLPFIVEVLDKKIILKDSDSNTMELKLKIERKKVPILNFVYRHVERIKKE